jgi:hypothetical protein
MAQSIERNQGRSLDFAAISVGSGTTQLVAAPASDNDRIHVCSYVLVADAAGTVKFSDGTDLTGAMSCAANGGVSYAGQASSPCFAAAPNTALSVVTTAGFKGHLSYVIES